MTLKALIFDVDGTLAETEECHRQAFNQLFQEVGMDWNWDRGLYRELLKTNGGIARLRKYADMENVARLDAARLHSRKTEIYQENVLRGNVPLRPGVERLIREARTAGLAMAIATATGLANVHSLLKRNLGEGSIEWFEAIYTAKDVSTRKPDPEVFHLTLDHLNLKAHECLVFEDSRHGLVAAAALNIPTLITPGIYTDDQDFSEAMSVVSNLGEWDKPATHIAGTKIGKGVVDLAALELVFSEL